MSKKKKGKISHNQERKQKYKNMSNKGELGSQELKKYDFFRRGIIGKSSKYGSQFPSIHDNEHLPTREDYNKISSLYDKLFNSF